MGKKFLIVPSSPFYATYLALKRNYEPFLFLDIGTKGDLTKCFKISGLIILLFKSLLNNCYFLYVLAQLKNINPG